MSTAATEQHKCLIARAEAKVSNRQLLRSFRSIRPSLEARRLRLRQQLEVLTLVSANANVAMQSFKGHHW